MKTIKRNFLAKLVSTLFTSQISFQSFLFITGNYSCSPSNSYPLQITLNVINGMVHKILCSLYIFKLFLLWQEKGIILIIFLKKAGIYFLASLRLKSCVPQHNFWSQKGNKLMTKFIIHFFALIVFYMSNFFSLIPFLSFWPVSSL